MVENIQNRFVMAAVVMLISDLLHVLHFLHHDILKQVETFLWYFKQLPAKKGNWPFDHYKISEKYPKLQFLKAWDAMNWIKTTSEKKLKEKNAFDKAITTYYCQNIIGGRGGGYTWASMKPFFVSSMYVPMDKSAPFAIWS